jgi:hydroxypyruvate isomerase
MDISRRNALRKLATLSGSVFLPGLARSPKPRPYGQAEIKQSVSRWPYNNIPLDTFCAQVKEIGIQSVELVGPGDWDTLQKHNLHCAMVYGAEIGLTKGFNDPQFHDQLEENYKKMIPQVADAGFTNLICFSGNRNGMEDEEGLQNCVDGLERILPVAEKHSVTICMELLNSKVNHPGYMCDHTDWGTTLCDELGSDNFKLLYDIYHMQIMEGDVIRTIRNNHSYFAHYHTGGVPGRNEIDESQELNYPAIMNAIAETGFRGWVGQEFIPSRGNPMNSLREAYQICNI